MQREIRLLYSSKEIFKYFKPALNRDYYDTLTMKNFVKKYVDNFSVEELNTMLETVKSDNESNNMIHSNTTNNINSIISLISIICAVMVAFYVALLSFIISQGKLEFVPDGLSFMYWIIGLIFSFILLIFILSLSYTRKYIKLNKLQKIIQITITIKEAELISKK